MINIIQSINSFKLSILINQIYLSGLRVGKYIWNDIITIGGSLLFSNLYYNAQFNISTPYAITVHQVNTLPLTMGLDFKIHHLWWPLMSSIELSLVKPSSHCKPLLAGIIVHPASHDYPSHVVAANIFAIRSKIFIF